jgi:flavin reductase (DIM6/NTAB) family NADH-FMN oxidoreductase RutF
MSEISFSEQASKAVEVLSKGAFLTTSYGRKTNTMTIAWGSIGFMWGKPVFTVMVRPSRFTYQLIEQSNEFTVSIPLIEMKQAITLCGTQSGRDIDKITAAGLSLSAGKKVTTPVIAGCGLHYECRIIYKQTMDSTIATDDLNNQWYSSGDHHTLYFGEIVATYTK